MGIQGLSTFLNQYHARYNNTIFIRDTPVVIDGNNLMYFLLSNPCGVNAHLVGGDWIFYSTRVRDFFQHLKDCRVTSIVIFDGAYEPEKWKTVFKRYRDTLKANVHSQMPGNSYTPVVMSVVFREILVEQGILHYQTELEADDTMAFISKRLQCPLLSSDSDFYIYPNIQNIPLSAIEFRKSQLRNDKSGQKKIVCAAKVLALDRLCKEEFNFTDIRLLPLVAVILGNDRIPTATFANLLKDKAADKIHRIKYVFEWLGRHRDVDHVLAVILQTLKEAERNEALSLVQSVLKNYQGEEGEVRVWNSLVQELQLNLEEETRVEAVNDPDQLSWYLPLHRNCTFPTYLLNILRNRTLLLQPSVEISHFPSTHELFLDIIRVTGGILLGDAELMLITRQRKQVVTVEVKTFTELTGFGSIPTIQVPKFRNQGENLLHSVFQLNEAEVTFVGQWPSALKFLMCCLLYFFKKMSGWSIARPLAVAILLLFLNPIFENNKLRKDDGPKVEALGELIRTQTWTKRLTAFFARFDAPASFTKARPYEISYVYAYCQFQCLLVHSIMLSKLLGNPYRLPKLQQLNSHFVYNVIRSIFHSHQKNPSAFLLANFGKSPQDQNILAIFDQFFQTVNRIKKTEKEIEVSASGNEESDEEAAEEGRSEDELLNDFISNRFAKLKVR